jgi:hypothetical protein
MTRISVAFIPLWYIIQILTRITANHNKNLLLVSIDITCFGHADHPQALKYMTTSKTQVKYGDV